MELMVSPAITHKTIKEHKHLDDGGIIIIIKKKSLELSYSKVGHGVPGKDQPWDPSGEIPIWVLTTGLGFQVWALLEKVDRLRKELNGVPCGLTTSTVGLGQLRDSFACGTSQGSILISGDVSPLMEGENQEKAKEAKRER